jgi:hypothetical protein
MIFVLGHGFDRDHEVVSAPRHDGGEGSVIHRSITADGSAEGDGPIDLFDGRKGGFELDMLSLCGLWWGQGESCEISIDL